MFESTIKTISCLCFVINLSQQNICLTFLYVTVFAKHLIFFKVRKMLCWGQGKLSIYLITFVRIWYNLGHMFGKMKQFAMKKVLQSQMKNVPEDQQKMIMEMLEKDPVLFEKIAKEMQAELKSNGNNQMAAATKVLPKYQKEIMAVMSPEMKEKLMKMQMGGGGGQFNANGSIRK